MRIPDHIIEQIRDQVDIVDVIGAHVQLAKKGKNYLGLCPFHKEKTPSFNVNRDRGFYKCFGCGRSGDAIAFVQELLHLDFVESVKHIATRMGIAIPEEEVNDPTGEFARRDAARLALKAAERFFQQVLASSDGAPARAFFTKRGFGEHIVEQFALGASPAAWDGLLLRLQTEGFTTEQLEDAGLVIKRDDGKVYDRFRGRAMFPIRDHQGRTVGFSARTLTSEPDTPKYINSPQTLVFDKSRVLFGLDLARRSIAEHNEALLVEGQADVIALHQAGFTHAVATSGTSLTADHLALLKKFAPLITVIFDADEAGRKAMSRAIELALAGGMDARCVVLPTGEDPDSLIRAKGADAMQQALDAAMPWMEYQTERFRALGYLTDPTKQSVAVRTMLGWITSIPDKIQHPFLIRELARRFDLPEDLLLRESGTVRSTTPRLPKPPTTPAEPVRVARPTLLPAERTLLKVALTVENGLTDMLHVFEVSAETFVTPLATEVFDRVLQAAEEHHDFTDHLISTQDFTEDARGVLLEIVQSAEGVSTRWLAHNVDIPVLETHRLIRDAITWLKSHRIKLELDDLQARLKAVQDHEEVLRIANKIGVLKQKQLELKQGLDYPTQEPSWHDADSASAS